MGGEWNRQQKESGKETFLWGA